MKSRIVLLALLLIMAGCNGITTPNTTDTTSAPSANTPTQNVTTSQETPTASLTQTPTEFQPENWNRTEKYEFFVLNYNNTFPHNKVDLVSIAILAESETIGISYNLTDTTNTTSRKQGREIVLSRYVAVTRWMLENESEPNKSWIPKVLVVESRDRETGEVYSIGQTNYTTARRYDEAEISYQEYIRRFTATLEYGPAAPGSIQSAA